MFQIYEWAVVVMFNYWLTSIVIEHNQKYPSILKSDIREAQIERTMIFQRPRRYK